jgi:hypothetical protein
MLRPFLILIPSLLLLFVAGVATSRAASNSFNGQGDNLPTILVSSILTWSNCLVVAIFIRAYHARFNDSTDLILFWGVVSLMVSIGVTAAISLTISLEDVSLHMDCLVAGLADLIVISLLLTHIFIVSLIQYRRARYVKLSDPYPL